MQTINIGEITIRPSHRAIKPWLLEQITQSMAQHGYNVAYPIVIDNDGALVEGRHRVEAAKRNNLQSVPFIYKPADVSPIRFGLQCNADGQLTAEDDVFDLAELCWTLAEVEGWSGQSVADELGISRVQAQQYKSIKDGLHFVAWNLARRGVTKNQNKVTQSQDALVTQEVTKVTWVETHFRSFLKELPYIKETPCRPTMRAQVNAILEIIERFAEPQKKVTAAYCGEVAAKWAWFRKLARDGFDRISPDVELKDKKDVLRQIYACKFGTKSDDRMHAKFIEYVDSLNQKVLRLWLVNGKAEKLSFITDDFVDVIITSPPYNLGEENWPMGGGGRESRDGIGYATHSDTMGQAEYEKWQIEVMKELYRVAKPGASFFYNHKVRTVDGRLISPMRWLDHPDNPWTLRQEIIWNRKSTHNHAEGLFWPIDERIYWMTKGKPTLMQPVGKPTIWDEFGPVPGTWHPAPFTEKLPQMILDALHVAPMSVVLDPFSGSGTTVKVALTYQCQAIGVDLAIDYLRKSVEVNKWPDKCIYTTDDIFLGGGNER